MAQNYHCSAIDPLVTTRGKPVPNSNALQWKSNRLYLPILLISLPIQSGFAIFRNWTMSLAQDFNTLLARQIHAGQKSKAKAIYGGSASSISNVRYPAANIYQQCSLLIKYVSNEFDYDQVQKYCFLPWIDPENYSACSQYWILAILQFADRGHQFHFHGLKWMWSVLPV